MQQRATNPVGSQSVLSGPIIASIQPGYGQHQSSFLGPNPAPAQPISATQRPANTNLFNSFQGNPASELSSAVGNLQHLPIAPSPVHYVNTASQGGIQQSAPHMQSYNSQSNVSKFQTRHLSVGRSEKQSMINSGAMMQFMDTKKSPMEQNKAGSYLSLHADAKPFNPSKRPGFEQQYMASSRSVTSVPEPMGMPASSSNMMNTYTHTTDDPFRKSHKDTDSFIKPPSRPGSLHFLDDNKGHAGSSQFDSIIKASGDNSMPPSRSEYPSSVTAFTSFTPVSSVFQSKSSAFSEPSSSSFAAGIPSSTAAAMPNPITTNPKLEPQLTLSQKSTSQPKLPLSVESEMRSMSPSKQPDLQHLTQKTSSPAFAEKKSAEPSDKESIESSKVDQGNKDSLPSKTGKEESGAKDTHPQSHGMTLDHQMNKRPKSLPSSNHGRMNNPNNQPPMGSFRVRPGGGGAQYPRHMMGPQPPMMNHPHHLGPMMRFPAPGGGGGGGGGLNPQTMRYRAQPPPHAMQQMPPTSSSSTPPHSGSGKSNKSSSSGSGRVNNQEQSKQSENFKKPHQSNPSSRNGAPSKLVFPHRVRCAFHFPLKCLLSRD